MNDIRVDISTFRDLAHQELPFYRAADPAAYMGGRAGKQSTSDYLEQSEIARLEKAVATYHGPFLEGFSLSDNVAFEEWLVLKREQIRQHFLTALRRLAVYYEAKAAYEVAMRYVWRQVEVEPWSEPAQRQLIRLLAYTGQRAAALDQFAAHKQVLATELGIEPEVATIQLYQQIRDGELGRGIKRPRESEKDGTAAVTETLPFITPAVFCRARARDGAVGQFLAAGSSRCGTDSFYYG